MWQVDKKVGVVLEVEHYITKEFLCITHTVEHNYILVVQ